MVAEELNEDKEDIEEEEVVKVDDTEREDFIKEYFEERKMYNEDDDWETVKSEPGVEQEGAVSEDMKEAGLHLDEDKDATP